MTGNVFLDAQKSWLSRRWVLLVAVLCAVALACAVVSVGTSARPVTGARIAGPDGNGALFPASSRTQGSARSSNTDALAPSAVTSSSTAPSLLQGERLESGIAVGYPHTLTGAVSAAAEFWSQAGSTLDPDRAAAIGRVVADPDWPTAPEDFAAGAQRTREGMGLPQAQPGYLEDAAPVPAAPDAGTAAAVWEPAAFQVRDVSTDRMLVLFLAYRTITSDGQSQTTLGVYPAFLHWVPATAQPGSRSPGVAPSAGGATGADGPAGDWKAEKGSEGDYSSLLVQPGTSEARAAGWTDLTS